jgi:hypothetical protein
MSDQGETVDSSALRRATAVMLLGVLAWQSLWLMAVYLATGGKEFADDMIAYRAYVADPLMLLTERHQELFGGAVASPLLPIELTVVYRAFEPLGSFLAYRLTMAVHILAAIGTGFAVAFRQFGVPVGKRGWVQATFIAVVPVAWVTSVLTVQDDCIAAAWCGLCLAACVWLGPVAGAVAAGLGIFFGKLFLGLAFLGIWIAFPPARWRVSAVGAMFVAALLAFVLWRDGNLSYSEYVYSPHMGASPYGVALLLGLDFDLFAARNLSALLTAAAFIGFTVIAIRRRLSVFSAVTGLHTTFLVTYFGAMPEYYVWFLPFLIVTLWCCARRRYWGTLALGWLSSFLAYAYKVVYGFNSRFPGGKQSLKQWFDAQIGIDLLGLQIAIAMAAVLTTLLFAICVLFFDPSRRLEAVERSRVAEASF